jgi:hypothetical protein
MSTVRTARTMRTVRTVKSCEVINGVPARKFSSDSLLWFVDINSSSLLECQCCWSCSLGVCASSRKWSIVTTDDDLQTRTSGCCHLSSSMTSETFAFGELSRDLVTSHLLEMVVVVLGSMGMRFYNSVCFG